MMMSQHGGDPWLWAMCCLWNQQIGEHVFSSGELKGIFHGALISYKINSAGFFCK